MRLLLDSHALLWWFASDARLSPAALELISDRANEVHVSAVSVWEIATKYRIGKLPTAELLVGGMTAYLIDERFDVLELRLEHALRAGLLAGPHKDPFDRMLIAQALEEDLVLVSNETLFDSYGVRRVW